jgi:pantoate--beta-alanine ligase
MIVAHEVADVRQAVRGARRSNLSVGCVPTMGALHAGHMSLIEAARRDCRFVAVTIFVNPTQFGPHEDFSKYPRPLEGDLRQCESAGVDLVFVPAAETMYPPAFGTFVEVEALERILEGALRPGHFRGVATIVLKLLNIVQPDAAYFGRKDFQQQLLVRKMCRELDLPVEIRTCPTVREADGLALSSRNRYLDLGEREKALALSQVLRLAEQRLQQGESDLSALRLSMRRQMESVGLTVDYATIVDPENLQELSAPRAEMVALVAARVGRTRLIDNFRIVLQGACGLRSSE